MSGLVFVDTNVLVYRRDLSEPDKQPVAQEWLEMLWRERAGRISVQVLQEYYVTVTAKLQPGLERESAQEDVRALTAWRPIPPDLELLESAWDVETRFGFSFWDALVVGGARRAGCAYLLTEDLQDGQVVEGVTIVNPFRHTPRSVLG